MNLVNKCEKNSKHFHVENGYISILKCDFHFLTPSTKIKNLNIKIRGRN